MGGNWDQWIDDEDGIDGLLESATESVSLSRRIGSSRYYPDIPKDGHMREVRMSKGPKYKRSKRAFVEKERAKKAQRKRKS